MKTLNKLKEYINNDKKPEGLDEIEFKELIIMVGTYVKANNGYEINYEPISIKEFKELLGLSTKVIK